MSSESKLLTRIQQLEGQLEEANEALSAIRNGEVDAFVISGPSGDNVYTLKGADHPYRILVQDMREGALILSQGGSILYSNSRFAELVKIPLQKVIGSTLQEYISKGDSESVKALLREGALSSSKGEVCLKTAEGGAVPVFLTFNNLTIEDAGVICLVVTDLTDQKRADEILAAETLARAILDQAAEAVIVVDPDGKIIRANRAAAALAACDVLLRRFDEVFPLRADTNGRTGIRDGHDLCVAACTGRIVKGLEAVLSHPDKAPIHMLCSAGPLVGPKSDSFGCVITLTDITVHRSTEQELRASEEHRRLAVEAASIGTWNRDMRSGRLVLSDLSKALFGLQPEEEITVERFLEMIHPEDRFRLETQVKLALDGGTYDIEFRGVWPDNSIHWVAARGRVEFDSDGQPVRMQGTALNIDERKRMENALHQAGDMVNTIIAGAPVAIWLVDVSGKIALWNPAAEKLFGYTFGEVISKPGLFHLESPTQAEVLQRLRKGQVLVGLEAKCQSKNRILLDVSLSVSALQDPDGSPHGFVALAADVTEKKKLEEQIRQAQKLESIGLLAGGVAHDFNNLLTGIIGNASLLLDEVTGESRERVENLLKAGDRAANLTRQLLAYAGKGHFHLQAIDLSAVIQGLMPLVRTSIPKKVDIHLELEDGLPAIESDRSQIEQVVMNLVINAGEALGDGTGGITVRTGVQDLGLQQAQSVGVSAGRYAALEVSDTGCGMNEMTTAKIFEPFFTTKFTGRGLGLAAVHGIVRSCRGVIKVDSEEGMGSRFTVLFPVIEQPAAKESADAEVIPEQTAGVILVVDDEDIVRMTAQAALERFGFSVLVAANGKEAVEQFRMTPYQIDAVLLDVKMPIMDGREALEELKLIRRDVKVLVSSGYNEAEALRAFVSAGVAGFIQKPYRASELAEMVRSLIAAEPESQAGSGV